LSTNFDEILGGVGFVTNKQQLVRLWWYPDHDVNTYRNLKLFYSLTLSLNTDPTCRQRLWSYDRMVKIQNGI